MIGRRRFLVLGAGFALAACGSSKGSDGSTESAATAGETSTGSLADGTVLVNRFSRVSLTPGRVRLPVSLAAADGTLLETGPDELAGTIVDEAGATIATVSARRHGDEMRIPYWPFVGEVAAPGIYYLRVGAAEAAFQLFDAAEPGVPTVGRELPPFDTPTVDDARGVDPVCTRTPDPCPFHEVTLTEALAAGKPVVYIVGTPAHCATGTCAPGLEYLIDAAATIGDRATFVHAEVYADNAATTVAPAVGAAGLDYEPVVFVTDAKGIVTERIDIIWDGDELPGLLERALS